MRSMFTFFQNSYCKFHPNIFAPELCTYEGYKWVQSVLFSRTFSVKVEGEAMPGLVPVADLLNTEKQELIQVCWNENIQFSRQLIE